MSYVLKNGNFYFYKDKKNAVCKTEDATRAAKFATKADAKKVLVWASAKLKGYSIVPEPSQKRKRIPTSERGIVYSKAEGRCAICGRFVPYEAFTVDHVKPLARGGTYDTDNLQCACEQCNRVKQDLLPNEFYALVAKIFLYRLSRGDFDGLWTEILRIRRQRRREKLDGILRWFGR